MGKRHETLVQNGEPTDAGVENGNRQGAIEGAATGAMVRQAPRNAAGPLGDQNCTFAPPP